MNGAFGIVSALLERERTGRGRVVRTSLLASIVGVHAFQGTRHTVAGEVPTGEGNHHPSLSPYGLFETADSPVQIACGNDDIWRRLCGVVGFRADEPGLATNADRVAHRDLLTARLNQVLRASPADRWLKLLDQARVPPGRVRTMEEVYSWEQTRSQGLLVKVDHPTLGPVTLPGPAL